MAEDSYGNIIMMCLLVIAFYFMSVAPYLNDRFYEKHGIRSNGKILKVTKTAIEYGDGVHASRLYEFILEVTLEDGKSKRVELKRAYDRDSSIPEAGENIRILIHPKYPDKVRLEL